MTHYVARIVIEKVEKVTKPAGNYGGNTRQPESTERVVTEIATVVTKADDLTTLVRKTQAHLSVEVADEAGK